MRIQLNYRTIKQLFILACIFAVLSYASYRKLTERYVAGGIIYDGYFGHTAVGTKNKKELQNEWIKAVPIESKRFTIRKGTTAVINPYASNSNKQRIKGDGIFYVADTINLPDSLTTIGPQVFSNTKGLKSIVIPNSVTSLGKAAFSRCTDLRSITLSDNITEIPDYCFYACIELDSISIPKKVTSIGSHAFAGCTWLKSASIPDSVTKISGKAFAGCDKLKKVSVSQNTVIKSNAFPPKTKIIVRKNTSR